MALMGIKNMSAYLRKISQDGFLYNVEYPGLHEVCSQIESISVNINQITKRVNSTGTIYAEDMRQIKKGHLTSGSRSSVKHTVSASVISTALGISTI